MDLAFPLAETIVETRYERLPEAAVTATKKDILDILGTQWPPAARRQALSSSPRW